MRRQHGAEAAPPPPPEEEYVWESASASLAHTAGSSLAAANAPAASAAASTAAAAAAETESRRSYARRHTTRELADNGGSATAAAAAADTSLSPRGKQCVRCGHSARIMLRVGTATEPSPLCRSCAQVAQSAPTPKARPGDAPAGTAVILDVRIPHIDVAKKMKFATEMPVSTVIKEVLQMLHKSKLIPDNDVSRPYLLLRRETDPLTDAVSTRRTVGELGLSIKTPIFLVRKPVQGDIFLDV